MVKELATKEEFDAFLKEAGSKLVVIDFTATWCGPCKKIAPEFAKLPEEYPEAVFAKVDVDKNDETAAAEGVTAMPTFKLYKDCKKVDELVGAKMDDLKSKIQKNL